MVISGTYLFLIILRSYNLLYVSQAPWWSRNLFVFHYFTLHRVQPQLHEWSRSYGFTLYPLWSHRCAKCNFCYVIVYFVDKHICLCVSNRRNEWTNLSYKSICKQFSHSLRSSWKLLGWNVGNDGALYGANILVRLLSIIRDELCRVYVKTLLTCRRNPISLAIVSSGTERNVGSL